MGAGRLNEGVIRDKSMAYFQQCQFSAAECVERNARKHKYSIINKEKFFLTHVLYFQVKHIDQFVTLLKLIGGVFFLLYFSN